MGLIGSVFHAGEVFIEPLARAVHQARPRGAGRGRDMAAGGGSLLLAARACGLRRSAVGSTELRRDPLAERRSASQSTRR